MIHLSKYSKITEGVREWLMVSALLKFNGLPTILPFATLDSTKCRLNCRAISHLSLRKCLLQIFRRSMKNKWLRYLSKNRGHSSNIAIVIMKRKRKYNLNNLLWKTRRINFSPFILIRFQLLSMIYATTNPGNGKMTIHSQIKISLTLWSDRDSRKVLFSWIETNLKTSLRLNSYSSSFLRLTNKR